jgi:hypothetical protein
MRFFGPIRFSLVEIILFRLKGLFVGWPFLHFQILIWYSSLGLGFLSAFIFAPIVGWIIHDAELHTGIYDNPSSTKSSFTWILSLMCTAMAVCFIGNIPLSSAYREYTSKYIHLLLRHDFAKIALMVCVYITRSSSVPATGHFLESAWVIVVGGTTLIIPSFAPFVCNVAIRCEYRSTQSCNNCCMVIFRCCKMGLTKHRISISPKQKKMVSVGRKLSCFT